jgi:hypothetical protein
MCKILIKIWGKEELVQIIDIRVDGGVTKNNKHKITTININSKQRIREGCKKIRKSRRSCTKYSRTMEQGCCTNQSNTMEQRMLYKIFKENRGCIYRILWEPANYIPEGPEGGCTKYF